MQLFKKKPKEVSDFSELFNESGIQNENEKKNGIATMKSTQTFSRIADIKDGIIITKDYDFVCIIEVSPINFELMSDDEQNAVMGQFQGALQVLPKNVQFKVLGRKPNIGARVKQMMKPLAEEENENCRNMLLEQVGLVRYITRLYGVSRRFFVIFKYEQEDAPALRRLTDRRAVWDDICTQMTRRRTQFEQAIQSCGNHIRSVPTDDCTLRMLYDIMHPYSNEEDFIDVDKRSNMAFNNHLGQGSFISPNDVLAYNSVNTRRANAIEADGLFYATAYIPSNGYSDEVRAGWLSQLIRFGDGYDIDVFLTKANQEAARQKLQYALRAAAMHDKETDATSTEKDAAAKRVDAGFYLKSKMSNGDDALCYISTLITVCAKSENELRDTCIRLKRECMSKSIPITFCRFEQEAAFRSVMPPLCRLDPNIEKKARRNIMLSDAVSAYPFLSFELDDPEGILYGRNMNGSLAIVDNFYADRYPNGNMTICGQTGAGKTYTLSCLCLRMREQGIQTFIIAPIKGFEFRRSAEQVGGQYIRIWPGSQDNINVMEIRKRDETTNIALDGREESHLVRKIQSLHTFFTMLLPTITEEETQTLDDALVQTYAKFGITEDNESLKNDYVPELYKRMPILGDLMDSLNMMDPDDTGRLRAVLSRFVTGSAKSFNAQTNVDLNNKFIVLDVSMAPDDLRPACMFIATDFVWDKCQEDRTCKKVIALDEVWQFIGYSAPPEVAKFVLDIFKLIRGYGGIGIAATQDISDFFSASSGEYGKAIVNACEFKCILKMKQNEVDFTRRVIPLTDYEADQISNFFGRGDMLLMAGPNNVRVHVDASPTEHNAITTKRSDLEKQVKQIKKKR